jgi:translation initiation factor IF-3
VPEVRLVGPSGEQVGIVSITEALRLAQESDLDLVEVAPTARPPVCKLMDYGKFKYESALKARESRKNQAQTVIKEIKIRPKIDPHDYGTKKGHVERFLRQGDKVKVTIMFRGREQSRPELGARLLQQLAVDVEELGFVESQPKLDGRNMIMVIGPHRKKAEAKAPVRASDHRASARAAAPARVSGQDAAGDRSQASAPAGQDAVAEATRPAARPPATAAAVGPMAGPEPTRPVPSGAAQPSAPKPAPPKRGPQMPPAESARPATPRPAPPRPAPPRPAAPKAGPATNEAGAPVPPRSAAPKAGPATNEAGAPVPPRPAAPKPGAPRASGARPAAAGPVPGPRARSAGQGATGAESGG